MLSFLRWLTRPTRNDNHPADRSADPGDNCDDNWRPSDYLPPDEHDESTIDPWRTRASQGEAQGDPIGNKNDPAGGAAEVNSASVPRLEINPAEADSENENLAYDDAAASCNMEGAEVINSVDPEDWRKVDGKSVSLDYEDKPLNHLEVRANTSSGNLKELDVKNLNDHESWPKDEIFGDEYNMDAYDSTQDIVPHDSLNLLDIDDFDPDAQQNPYHVDLGADRGLGKAREKASRIAISLDVNTSKDVNLAMEYLIEFFSRFPHPATYRSIKKISSQSIDYQTLHSIIELRYIWEERSDWWRRRTIRGHEANITRGASALTWAAAYRVCIARRDYPVEDMIDDRWLNEWLRLPRGYPGYFSFPDYIDKKVACVGIDGMYHEPAQEGGSAYRNPEVGEDIMRYIKQLATKRLDGDSRYG